MIRAVINWIQRNNSKKVIPTEPMANQDDLLRMAMDLEVPVNIVLVGKRERSTSYYEQLEEQAIYFAKNVFDDDDLEEFIFLMFQYATAKQYKLKGTPKQMLYAILRGS